MQTRIRVFRTGAHAHRTPLSYPALAPLFADRIVPVDRPGEADLYVFAHVLDIEAAPHAVIEDWRRRQRPVVLLSEEPFWDTIWARQPLAHQRLVQTRFGPLPVIQLNHQTSPIFHFERIPYYLLTHHRFATAYAARFARNAALTASAWARRFADCAADLVFMFERRPEPYHALRWPEGDLIGLCHWRTVLAEADLPGRVERIGRSWQDGVPARQSLPNWHLDKLARLDGQMRCLAAFENTHQPDYITEKLFDAFACGAVPLYFASPGHRVHELGLPAAAWLNLYDLPPAAAAERIAALRIDSTLCEAYAQAQARLCDLFGDPGLWVRERRRLQRAVLDELTALLDAPPSVSPAPVPGLTGSAEAPAAADPR